jgi:O-antigen/teichoic acid export membrane protein
MSLSDLPVQSRIGWAPPSALPFRTTQPRRTQSRRPHAASVAALPLAERPVGAIDALKPIDAQPVPDIKRQRLGRNVTALTAGQLITWTMTLLWTFVVPRMLGPAGMGIIVAAWSVTGILGIILGLGTRNYLVREMVVDPSSATPLMGTAIVLRLLMAPVFMAAVVIYGRYARYGTEGTLVLYLAGVATILTLLSEPMQAGFQAIERMEYLAYSDVINKSAQGLLGVAVAVLGFRSVGITACWMVVAGVVIIVDAFWLRPHIRLNLRTSYRQIGSMIKQSAAYWTFGLFFIVYLWIDSVMLSLMTRPEVVGWYGVPTKLFQTLLFLPVIVSTAWLPRLVESFKESRDHLQEASRAPLELVLVLSIPICVITAMCAPAAMHLLYGPSYDRAIPVMILLSLCIPPMYMNIMLSQVLIAAKRQIQWTWVMAGATVVNPLCNAFLIRLTEQRYNNGAIGAAISMIVTEGLIVIVGIVMVGYHVFDRRVVRRALLMALACGVMWGIALATRPVGAFASLFFGVITFVVLAAILRLVRPEEMSFVREKATALLQRVMPASRRLQPALASEPPRA